MHEGVSCVCNTSFSEINRSQAHGKVLIDLFDLSGRDLSIFYSVCLKYLIFYKEK